MAILSQIKQTLPDWDGQPTKQEEIKKPVEDVSMYRDLFDTLNGIDRKYSLKYVEPTIDMPETLGLELLKHDAPSQTQLKQQAEESTLAGYLKNLEKIQSNAVDTKNSIDSKILTAEEKLGQSLAEIGAKLEQEVEQAQKTAVNKGTARGSILNSMVENRNDNAESLKNQAKNATNITISTLAQQLGQLENATKSAIESLDQTRDADVQTALTKLLEDVQKQQDAIAKYNNTVVEKEQKYQTTRQQTIEKAVEAEKKRMFEALGLLQELGKVGFEELVMSEKMYTMRNYLTKLPREEALKLLETDAIKSQAGIYYTYLADFIKNK